MLYETEKCWDKKLELKEYKYIQYENIDHPIINING
jgi:hypothetical protein